MTFEEMAASSALYLWVTDQGPRACSEWDKSVFMEGHKRGQLDERERIRKFLIEKEESDALEM